jgi:hypothetical protein
MVLCTRDRGVAREMGDEVMGNRSTGAARLIAAVVVGIALVAGVGSLNGANAATLAAPGPVEQAVAALQQVEATASYQAVETATLAGVAAPADARADVQRQLTAVLSSPTFRAAAESLAPSTSGVAVNAGVPEFMYHVNQGNQRMLAAVAVFTVLVVPMALNCRVGDPLCVASWVLIGASLAAGAVVSGAFEYVAAVLSLP